MRGNDRTRPRLSTFELSAHAHPRVVSERLGHATVLTTLDIHSHCTASMQQETAEKIDAGLRAHWPAEGRDPRDQGRRVGEPHQLIVVRPGESWRAASYPLVQVRRHGAARVGLYAPKTEPRGDLSVVSVLSRWQHAQN
jgi:hypothetical protein